MKLNNILLICILMLTLTSCEELINDCYMTKNTKILDEEEAIPNCDFTAVFKYKSEIYATAPCCNCFIAPTPYSCDSDIPEDLADFSKNAELLYYVEI